MSITISTTAGDVQLLENPEGYRKGINRGGPYIIKQYTLEDWSKSDAVANALAGTSTASTIGGTITYNSPRACEESPNLFVQDVQVEGLPPFVVDDGRPRFDRAVVSVTYGVPDYNLASDPFNSFPGASGYTYAAMRMRISAEVLTLPAGGFKFQTNNVPVPSGPGKLIPQAELSFSRVKVPYLPTQLILDNIGKVNNATMFGAAVGCLLFMGADTEREENSDGTVTQQVTYSFLYRSVDHRKLWNPNINNWDNILDNANQPLYASVDLTTVIV